MDESNDDIGDAPSEEVWKSAEPRVVYEHPDPNFAVRVELSEDGEILHWRHKPLSDTTMPDSWPEEDSRQPDDPSSSPPQRLGLKFSPNYCSMPFGLEVNGVSHIVSIIGEELWLRVSAWNEKFNATFDEMTGVFGSEELRAEIDREYVALGRQMQEKLPADEVLELNMWW